MSLEKHILSIKEDIKKVKSIFHPYADLLLEWEKIHITTEKRWRSLTCDEMDIVLSADRSADSNTAYSNNAIEYISFENKEFNLLCKMNALERQKITNSIEKLKAFIDGVI